MKFYTLYADVTTPSIAIRHFIALGVYETADLAEQAAQEFCCNVPIYWRYEHMPNSYSGVILQSVKYHDSQVYGWIVQQDRMNSVFGTYIREKHEHTLQHA